MQHDMFRHLAIPERNHQAYGVLGTGVRGPVASAVRVGGDNDIARVDPEAVRVRFRRRDLPQVCAGVQGKGLLGPGSAPPVLLRWEMGGPV